MMATEATSENLVAPSSLPDDELNTTETPSQDVLSEQPMLIEPMVNGFVERDDNRQDAEAIDASVNSAEVSVSGGSDTEASKTETSKIIADGKGHVRTASTVKRPASFKSVSVNKTFLAAKGASPVTNSKLGDKAAPTSSVAPAGVSASATSRPRLVAKTASGLRDATPRASVAANGGTSGAAPDASAVWNKNRPAPPPEAKRYTDEELQKKYGIHLATRIHSEDQGKQANWADIDDDDDDWAPESIEWTDGTKISLQQIDDPTPPTPEPIPSPALNETKITDVPKTKSPAPTQASASPTVKTSTFGSGRAGLVLKGASEKPTLVAKPPGPLTPAKSPWAQLPPVDKLTPAAIDIPQIQPQQQSRFSQRDSHGFHGMPPPAKEIAADDFSRSWRDGANTSRELYNSQSGRYEPVSESRRGSSRNDGRHPALLQRPSQPDGPAEPSAAFQTHRASGQDGAYGRRRTSSNVSGGSGNFGRRMSRGHDMPPPHELLHTRRGSLAAVSDASSPRNFSPSGQFQSQRGQQNQHRQPHASPAASHPSPHSIQTQVMPPVAADRQSPPPATLEDPLEEQKKIMKQTRELAIKRRQEQEAKEEAERKERIRLKLEAMGPPPESKKNKKDSPKVNSVPAEIPVKLPNDAIIAGPDLEVDSNISTKSPVEPTASDIKLDDTSSSIEQRSGDDHSSTQPQRHQQETPSQSWKTQTVSNQDRIQPWASAPPQHSSRNVWGPPTNDKTLGNGTFNPDLSRIPDMQNSNPGPIGPANRGNDHFQQGRGRDSSNYRPAPIGPPNRQQPVSSQTTQRDRDRVANSGWARATSNVLQSDTEVLQKAAEDNVERQRQEAEGLQNTQPVIKDKWRQVSIQEDGTRSSVTGTHTLTRDGHGIASWIGPEEATTRPMMEDQGSIRRNFDTVQNQPQFNEWRSSSNINAPQARGSRFFPNNNRDVRLEEQSNGIDRPGSPSPPPPTMAGHPAYDGGDITHPHVSLPRPSPVVKLPPPMLAPIGPPKPASFAAAVTTPAIVTLSSTTQQNHHELSGRPVSLSRDIRRHGYAGDWQERINSLVGRGKPSPPKSHALAVDSSSKNALELTNTQYSTTVSLPSFVGDGTEIFTKPAAEECFEEQEMGSLPAIKVPSNAPSNAWDPAAGPKPLPRKFIVSDATSMNGFHFPMSVVQGNGIITVKVPGQDGQKSVRVPMPRQTSNPRRGSRGPRHSSSSYPRGGRGRDATSGFSNVDNTSTSTANSGRGGRGGRSFGSNWTSRNVSTPVHS